MPPNAVSMYSKELLLRGEVPGWLGHCSAIVLAVSSGDLIDDVQYEPHERLTWLANFTQQRCVRI